MIIRHRLIILLCLFFAFLYSEGEKDIFEEPDIENIECIEIDSLDVLQDSLFSTPDWETVQKDTLDFDLGEIRNQIDSLIYEEVYYRDHNRLLPYFLYSENFHYKTYPNPNLYITKNGFSLVPYLVRSSHIFQNLNPLYQADFRRNHLNFTQEKYELPVFLTNSFLGLGDENMNHVGVIFRKGLLLGIKNLNFNFGYLGQEGNWLGINEQSKHFDLMLDYASKIGSFYLFYSSLDQNISSDKFTDNPQDQEKIKEKVSDLSFYFENPYINLGAKYEKIIIDNFIRHCYNFKFDKKITLNNHLLMGKIEFIKLKESEEDYFQFSLDHESRFNPITLINYGVIKDSDNYSYNNRLNLGLYKGISLISDNFYFSSYDKEIAVNSVGLGITTNFIAMELLYSHKNEFTDNDMFELFSNLNIEVNSLEIILENHLSYLFDFQISENDDSEKSSLPKYRIQNRLELIYHLKFDNAIKLGIDQIFFSDYYAHLFNLDMTPSYVGNALNFDGYISVQISTRFEIRLDVVNITNETHVFSFDRDEMIPATHFNFNIFWTFIN